MNEDKATRYQRLRRRAQAFSFLTTTALLLLLVSSGAAVGLRRLLDDSIGPTATGTDSFFIITAYALLLALALRLVRFPFVLVEEWLLDRRYELNRLPFSEWLAPYGRASAAELGLAVAAGALPALAWWSSPAWWWLIAALVIGAARLGLAAISPVLVASFGHLHPLERPALERRLQGLAERAGLPGRLRVHEWREDTAGRRVQAAMMGLGRTRHVMLADTLLASSGDDEIEVVVAHELAHSIHHDLWKGTFARVALLVAGFGVAQLFLSTVGPGVGVRNPADAAALPFILLAVELTIAAASPLLLAWSRGHERRADDFALRMTDNPDALLSVLRRLGAVSLAEERPSPLATLLASHPPVPERMAAVRAWQTRHAPSPQAQTQRLTSV